MPPHQEEYLCMPLVQVLQYRLDASIFSDWQGPRCDPNRRPASPRQVSLWKSLSITRSVTRNFIRSLQMSMIAVTTAATALLRWMHGLSVAITIVHIGLAGVVLT